MYEPLGRRVGESNEDLAKRCEREAGRCMAHTDREWSHHAAQSRREASDLREQARCLRSNKENAVDRAVIGFIPFQRWDELLFRKLEEGIFDQFRYARSREIKLTSDRSGWEFAIYLPVVLPIPGF